MDVFQSVYHPGLRNKVVHFFLSQMPLSVTTSSFVKQLPELQVVFYLRMLLSRLYEIKDPIRFQYAVMIGGVSV